MDTVQHSQSDVTDLASQLRDEQRRLNEAPGSWKRRSLSISASIPGLNRMTSRSNFSLLRTRSTRSKESKEDAEDLWEVHPVQDKFGDTCSLDIAERLCQSCLRQIKNIPFQKKKKVSGLREVESSLEQLRSKLEAEKQLLSKYQGKKELRQSLLVLQDTLRLLSRKFHSVSKRRYFLDAAYSKRILVLHQSLNSAMNDVFLCLSRQIWQATIKDKREEDSFVVDTILNRRKVSTASVQFDSISPKPSSNQFDDDAIDDLASVDDNKNEGEVEEEYKQDNSPLSQGVSDAPSDLSRDELLEVDSDDQEQISDEGERLFNLGRLHLFRGGVDEAEDNRKALMYFARASRSGSCEAMIMLAKLYEKGVGCDSRDLSLAQHFLVSAANVDNTSGMVALALFQLRNLRELCPENDVKLQQELIVKSVELLRKASRSGNPDAMCVLGEFYLEGKQQLGIPKSFEKAKALFAAAARVEHARAQNNLGVLLLQDDSSRKEGLHLLEISAGKGCAKAQNNLGMYHEGLLFKSEHTIISKNLPLAIELYRKAANQGLPLAMHNLAYGNMQIARRFEQGSSKCCSLLEEAVELLSCSAAKRVIDSHYYLGILYESGVGVIGGKNLDLAVHHLRLVAFDGKSQLRPKAALRLADIYYKRKEYVNAIDLYKRCANDNNCPIAMNSLGLLFEAGKCKYGEPNLQLAAVYYEKANTLGNPDAAFNLALLRLEGKGGVPKDRDGAMKLIKFAASKGNKGAIAISNKLF